MNIQPKYKLFAGLLVLIGVFMYGRCGRSGPKPVIKPILPVNDSAQITVNPSNHTVTVQTTSGSHTTFLPDGPSLIDVEHNGIVKVTAKQFGLERHVFGGIGYGDDLRIIVGADLLYFRRFDLGLGLTVPLTNSMTVYRVRALAAASYTVFDNTRLTLGIDNQKVVNGFVTVRF
jgi:hypothetical protein